MNVRGIRILKYLIENGKSDIKELSENFNITMRTIYYDIDRINYRLNKKGLKGIIKEGKNICLVSTELDEIQKIIKKEVVFTPQERVLYLCIKLFSKEVIKLSQEAEKLQITRKTLEGDMKEIKKIFESEAVEIVSLPGKGVTFRGDELSVRKIFGVALYVAFMKKDNLRSVFRDLMEELYENHGGELVKEVVYEISKYYKINTNNFFFLGFLVILLMNDIRRNKFKETREFLEIKGYEIVDGILKKYYPYMREIDKFSVKHHLKRSDMEDKDIEDDKYMIARKFINELKKYVKIEKVEMELIKAISQRLDLALFKHQNIFGYEPDYDKKDLPKDVSNLYYILEKICLESFGGFYEEDIFMLTIFIKNKLEEENKKNKNIIVVDKYVGKRIIDFEMNKIKKIVPIEVVDIVPFFNLDKHIKETEKKIDYIFTFEKINFSELIRGIDIPVLKLDIFNIHKTFEVLRLNGLF